MTYKIKKKKKAGLSYKLKNLFKKKSKKELEEEWQGLNPKDKVFHDYEIVEV